MYFFSIKLFFKSVDVKKKSSFSTKIYADSSHYRLVR